ncbi:MAG: hypothetical protein ABSG19_03700 [Candidatus Aminicenantales bacterium]
MMVRRGTWGAILLAGISVMMLTAGSAGQTQTPAQKYDALLGMWDVKTEGASYTFVFEFFLEDGVLKGKYTGSSGTTKMDNLTFENNILKFSVTVNTMALDYSAVIDGDKLSGQVTLQYGQADISGEKRKRQADRAS